MIDPSNRTLGVELIQKANQDGARLANAMYNIAQLFEDPHYQFRESFIRVPDKDFGEVRIPNVVAKFSLTPGEVRTLGPSKGEHTIEILKEHVGLSEEKIEQLKNLGII